MQSSKNFSPLLHLCELPPHHLHNINNENQLKVRILTCMKLYQYKKIITIRSNELSSTKSCCQLEVQIIASTFLGKRWFLYLLRTNAKWRFKSNSTSRNAQQVPSHYIKIWKTLAITLPPLEYIHVLSKIKI